MKYLKSNGLPAAVFILVLTSLSFIHMMAPGKMLIAERFFPGWGWVQILITSLYGFVLVKKMADPLQQPHWRRVSWTVFSVFFFVQLLLGLTLEARFLMTGKLHWPIPAMIVAGPLYRADMSFMAILFLSTVILTGPAWCSQLCYFGAFDNLMAHGGRPARKQIKGKYGIKFTILLVVIASALIFRIAGLSSFWTTTISGAFGVGGLIVMFAFSRSQNRMIHCLVYCPIGTIVNYLGRINPFRVVIEDTSCTDCMLCSISCRYDALSVTDVRSRRAGRTCTACGDCISTCRDHSLRYTFLTLSSDAARNLYLILTVSLHTIFLAVARL